VQRRDDPVVEAGLDPGDRRRVLAGEQRGPLGGDRDEVADAFEPDVSTAPGLDPLHRDFAAARAAGITTALVLPGEQDLVGGAGALVKTTNTL